MAQRLNMNSTMNDPDFDDLLRSARGNLPLPSSFRQAVWRRIETDAVVSGRQWWSGVLAIITRPWGAVTGLAATVALGLWLGAVTPHGEERNRAAYADSISPFAQSHHP